jgi:diacylglycerol kinase (ATP)
MMDIALPSGAPLVILNPAANRGDMRFYREFVQREALIHGAHYVETRWAGDAKELAQQAAQEGRSIIMVGGDGTLNEIVNGILAAEKRVPLGIIAAGSGNDFAWNTLKLPRDPHGAVERAFNGRLLDVDAGKVNGHFFANGFSVGLDADISVATNTMRRWPLLRGSLLYTLAAVRQLLFGYHRCPWLEFAINEESLHSEQRYILLAVTNGPAYGAGFHINPSADCCDGLLDICAVDYTPVLRTLKLLPGVKKGKHVSAPEVKFYRAHSIHIKSRRPVMLQADGEVTIVTIVDAQILPAALCVRV